MKQFIKSSTLAIRIWFLTSCVLGIGFSAYFLFFETDKLFWVCFPVTIVGLVVSLPILAFLIFDIPVINKIHATYERKLLGLFLCCLIATAGYGCIGGALATQFRTLQQFLETTGLIIAALFASSCVAIALSIKQIQKYFGNTPPLLLTYSNQNQTITQTNKIMETTNQQTVPNTPWDNQPKESKTNKILIKGIITGVLILLLMIPTVFVTNLVIERQQRQAEVVKEVSAKWASAQTVTFPYLYIPYSEKSTNDKGKEVIIDNYFVILPENLNVTGSITPEEKSRSIYKVLLYKSNLESKGNFILNLPKNIDAASLKLADAKLCMGLSDYKGIDERIVANFHDSAYELSAGLPTKGIDAKGLSVGIKLSAEDIGKSIAFDMPLKIKGSEQLSFVPLSGNSNFTLSSNWSSPSFNGSNVPGVTQKADSGFTAKWSFTKANLPFNTIMTDFDAFNKNASTFGVNMLQPADQYAKTMRSVKYAILFIGLTFALFFIVELMQKKPLHPVQYVLIGLALVIFYTLLLSISEFVSFDIAYLIASAATIVLITLYAKGHFANWKTAGIFGGVLTALYGFIFVLIRLEDTALLVGSTGLFVVLALVMYASKKIDWYGTNATVLSTE